MNDKANFLWQVFTGINSWIAFADAMLKLCSLMKNGANHLVICRLFMAFSVKNTDMNYDAGYLQNDRLTVLFRYGGHFGINLRITLDGSISEFFRQR